MVAVAAVPSMAAVTGMGFVTGMIMLGMAGVLLMVRRRMTGVDVLRRVFVLRVHILSLYPIGV